MSLYNHFVNLQLNYFMIYLENKLLNDEKEINRRFENARRNI